MVASRFYIAMVGVRFPLKVQNIYIGGIGIQRLKARAQVIHQKWLQVRILYINLLNSYKGTGEEPKALHDDGLRTFLVER